MGTGASANSDSSSHGGEEREDQAGGQLYVSLTLENYKLKGDLIPHVFGSSPIFGSWGFSKALPMERESTSVWQLSFVVPPNHETLEFKFLLRPKDGYTPCLVEEGPNRILSGGRLQGDMRAALFRLSVDAVLEFGVCIKADRVSPFNLAASWRAYQENLRPSTVRGIPDVSINSVPETGFENGSSESLELDLEDYVVPSPANSEQVYVANLTETPRSRASGHHSPSTSSHFLRNGGNDVDWPSVSKETELTTDPEKACALSGLVNTKSVVGTSLQKQESHKGLFVDRGVGSPRLVKSASEYFCNGSETYGQQEHNASGCWSSCCGCCS